MTEKLAKLNLLIERLAQSSSADFYQELSEQTRQLGGIKSTDDLGSLPQTSAAALAAVPLLERQYTSNDGYVKKIGRGTGHFLIKRTLADLGQEDFRMADCRRPLVLLSDNGEACEKVFWFFEKNILALPGEPNNLKVTAQASVQYGIDSIFTEVKIAEKFLPILSQIYDPAEVKKTVLLGDHFNAGVWDSVSGIKGLELILALPETGPFASACPEALAKQKLVFHPESNSLLELTDQLIVSRLILLPTPIIRYETGLITGRVGNKCECAIRDSFILR